MKEYPYPDLDRPGVVRRAAAGAWHVPSGFWFLLRHPSLWPTAVLPVLVALACLFSGLVLGAFTVQRLEVHVLPGRQLGGVWGFVVTIAVWIGVLGAGMALGLAVALLLTAPLLDRLSRLTERKVQGRMGDHGHGLRWEFSQSLRGSLYLLLRAPFIFLLGLIPVLGPSLGMFWGAHSVALQQTDMALTRRGFEFARRRAWHRRYRAESIGFGLAGLLLLVVPLADFLIAPVLAVGATLLVMEIEGEA